MYDNKRFNLKVIRKMIITTAGRTTPELINQAKIVAKEINANYVPRNKRSIKSLQQHHHDDLLVVGKNRLEVHHLNSVEPLFFHPNSAMFRIKRLMRGEEEPFLQAVKLSAGMSFLDCTLGLGSDSIVASYIVGHTGKVVSVEGSTFLAFIVKSGLQAWDSGVEEINKAMRSVSVQALDYLTYLRSCPPKSFDVVYFDPMFEETILQSDGIKGIKPFAIYSKLTKEIIEEAKRVAVKRIVLKEHWKSHSFASFGFHVYKRKTAKFHFGVIELE